MPAATNSSALPPIDYTPAPEPFTVPLSGDPEAAWVAACNAALTTLTGGRSLAFGTAGFVDDARAKATNIEDRALANMTGVQRQQYAAWRAGALTPPVWDWDRTAPIGDNPKTRNDWAGKTAALARIYDRKISNAQAKAWVLGNWDLHALWKAVTHLVRAERSACGGYDGMNPLAFVEAVACRKFTRRLACHTYKKEYTPGADTDVFAKVRMEIDNRLKVVDGVTKA